VTNYPGMGSVVRYHKSTEYGDYDSPCIVAATADTYLSAMQADYGVTSLDDGELIVWSPATESWLTVTEGTGTGQVSRIPAEMQDF
jgi:hypothetical protein